MASIERICESGQGNVPDILDSEQFKTCWSEIEATGRLTLKSERQEALSKHGWEVLMKILETVDVSHVKHLVSPMTAYVRYHDLFDLARVLRTGRFSALETLNLQGHLFLEKPRQHLFEMPGSEHLGKALKAGNFCNLRTLKLPPCHTNSILEAVRDADLPALQSFSVRLPPRCNSGNIPGTLQQIFQNGRFKGLHNLELISGALGGVEGFQVLVSAVKAGHIGQALRSLQLKGNTLTDANLADLVGSRWFSHLELLNLSFCGISSRQMSDLVERVIAVGTPLNLQRLDLGRNGLGSKGHGSGGIDALIRLANAGLLPNLQDLLLSQLYIDEVNVSPGPIRGSAIVGLAEAIERGHFPSLKILDWTRNPVGNQGAHAVVNTYQENKAATVDFVISSWDSISDPSLHTQALELRNENLLRSTVAAVRSLKVREDWEDELNDDPHKEESPTTGA